jgi:phosphoglycerate dehydrogenase-like enzyme
MKRVLIDYIIDSEYLSRLMAAKGVSVATIPPSEIKRPLPLEVVEGVQILLCSYPPENFSDMVSLELIQLTSSGYGQLFDLGLVEKGIRACNARGVFDIPIAEWTMAMMINLARDLRTMIRNQESGVWERQPQFQREIRGSVVGIWGYGGIGRQTARLAKAAGLGVHVMTRSGVRPQEHVYVVPGTGDPMGTLPDQVFRGGQELEFLAGLDFLVLAMPLTGQTRGIVGERQLAALPPHACILNPARGPLIEEQALIKALTERTVAGAALDTHHYYPLPADHPLRHLPNVIITPHISGSAQSQYTGQRVWDILVGNVEGYLDGRPLLNELTADQLQGN